MTHAPNTLDAFDEAPVVRVVDGEILLWGPHAEVSYTVPAARELARRLNVVVKTLDSAGS